jgi:elongation factor G
MWHLVECWIEPRSSRDGAELSRALARLAAEDRSFAFRTDAETRQTILHGLDERHLSSKIDFVARACPGGIEVGAFHVSYRETIVGRTEVRYTYKRQAGGAGEFADVTLMLEPIENEKGFLFENAIVGGVPRSFIEAVRVGLSNQKETGVLAAFPVIGVKATLIAARYHDADSTPVAFAIAAKAAFRELRATGLARILEPIVKITVITPTAYSSRVEADLRKRDAYPIRVSTTETAAVITAVAPMKMMLGYGKALHELADDRANYDLRFESYRILHLGPPTDLFPTAAGMRA